MGSNNDEPESTFVMYKFFMPPSGLIGSVILEILDLYFQKFK